MEIIQDSTKWQAIRNSLSSDITIGFVPTMGCLHQGHASLINQSVAQNDITVLSIFVNPTQFNDPQDYERYPKNSEADLVLAKALKVNYVIMPEINDLYPGGNDISVATDHLFSQILEGRCRPGHFNGVLTIVMKLLMLVRADHVYFGEKDYQQYFLITELIKKYFIQTKIILCPTVRELSGLPLSSRNTRLSADERKCIELFYEFFYHNRSHSLAEIKEKILALKMQYDYLEVHNDRFFMALKIGCIRIIDNFKEATRYVH